MDLIQAIRPIKPAPTSAEQAADKRFMLYGYEPSDPAGQETVLSLWDQSNRVLEDFVRDQNRSASHMDSGILAANTFNDPRINLRTSGLRTPPTESTLSLSHHSVLKSPSRTRTRQAAKSSLSKPGVKQPRGRPRLNISAADIIDRRRMQIRLNQRNHRQRKEDLIESLQQENQQLKAAVTSATASFARLEGTIIQCPEVQSWETMASIVLHQVRDSLEELIQLSLPTQEPSDLQDLDDEQT